jgi:phage gp36-like protein
MPYSAKTDIQKEISEAELIGLTNDEGTGSPKKVAFTSGGVYQILVRDVIVGAVSGATALVDIVVLTSGTWAAGTAAGDLYLSNQDGVFQAENLNVGTNSNVATIAGNPTDTEFAIKDSIVTAAIARADALIDSYAGRVETVPFTTVPPIIKQHSITISIYFLFVRRSAVPENRAQNYKDAIAWLKDLAVGKAALPPTTEADYEDTIQVDRTAGDRKMTMGKDSDGSLDNY